MGSGGPWLWSLHFLLPNLRVHNPLDHEATSAIVSPQNMKYCFRRSEFEINKAVVKPYQPFTCF